MAKITPYDYHSNSAKHGEYQYLTLKELINEIEFSYSDSDHHLKNAKRSRIVYYTKECIRTFNKQVFSDIKAMEITVPENLVITIPHNFVDWVRVSVVVTDPSTNSFRLKPLNVNHNINIAEGYLQDHNYDIIFDSNGQIITADYSSAYANPYKKYQFSTSNFNPYLDTSVLSKNGEFTIDKKRGKILFSSDLFNKEIVLEYISDGLEFDTYGNDAIKVHKLLSAFVKDWVYYALIEPRKNVSATEKERARRKYKTTLHQSKIDQADFDLLEISRAMRSSSKSM